LKVKLHLGYMVHMGSAEPVGGVRPTTCCRGFEVR